MAIARGVLIEESLLFAEDDDGNTFIPPRSAALLRRLKYSNLRVGICHQEDISQQKAIVLARTAASFFFDCISLHGTCVSNSLSDLLQIWGGGVEACFYVTFRKDEAFFSELEKQGWSIICLGNDKDAVSRNNLLFIDKLEELFITICSFSKMAKQNTSLLMVGYVMKASREEDFAKRGAFPMYPTQNGLMFIPLMFDLPLASQMQQVDIILHKVTDEITSIDLSSSLDFPDSVSFSRGMCELQRYIQDHPDHCMVDPLKHIYPLLDRYKIQQILLELDNIPIRDHSRIRSPHFLKLDNFGDLHLRAKLSEANLSFPVIVKPQVACGVADAHNMALVFKFEDFEDLDVPLPAIIQEYVDHGSLLFKFYVLGDKVFHAVKKSMPNASCLISSEKSGIGPIMFNSLKPLPVAKDDGSTVVKTKADTCLDVEMVNDAARWLRKRLGLSIFGFDVVIQEGSSDHVIVDLNYLPSFKEVPDNDAIPAFWEAIETSYKFMKEKNEH